MARFYLHLLYQGDICHDAEGFDAADLVAARGYSRRAAADVVADEIRQGSDDVAFSLCLDNFAGKRLATIAVKATVANLSALDRA